MTGKQRDTIKKLKESNLKLRKKIKKSEFVREVVKEIIVYKDLREKPVPPEEKYRLEIIMDYPNENGRIVLDTYERIIKIAKDNQELFMGAILPSFKPKKKSIKKDNQNKFKEDKNVRRRL